MRIITDDDLCSIGCDCDICQSIRGLGVGISDDELDVISINWDDGYLREDGGYIMSFSEYFRKLIELRRALI